jgi:methionyl-tRNA synthetase
LPLSPHPRLSETSSNLFFASDQTNKYFHAAEPWKTPDPQWVLYNVAESLRITAILLQPFMPGKSQELLEMLRVDTSNPSKRSFAAAVYGSDQDYGQNVQKGYLFLPLLTED